MTVTSALEEDCETLRPEARLSPNTNRPFRTKTVQRSLANPLVPENSL